MAKKQQMHTHQNIHKNHRNILALDFKKSGTQPTKEKKQKQNYISGSLPDVLTSKNIKCYISVSFFSFD